MKRILIFFIVCFTINKKAINRGNYFKSYHNVKFSLVKKKKGAKKHECQTCLITPSGKIVIY